MKICSVIVTYSNRFHFLKQVIDACYKQGIHKIIVVDNNSIESSKKQLKELDKSDNRLKVIYLDSNTGSAGGYKEGLKEAYECEECEYIWLLDDDNKPTKNSLNRLKYFWSNLNSNNKEKKISLLSYRKDRIAYKEAIMTNNPDLVLGRKNSFLNFHFLYLPRKILRVFKKKIRLNLFAENKGIKSGKVSVSPYGGMFFHKKIIDEIGYPNKKFFVYADDHEWSYRITQNDGKIILVLDSLINDIDTSWNIPKKLETSLMVIVNGDKFRLYYSTRNRVIFEMQYLTTNNIIYKINIIIFKFLVSLYSKDLNIKKIFFQAIHDGLNNKTGINENINF